MANNYEIQDPSDYSDKQITDMTLHELTDILGGDGLGRRFNLEAAKFAPQEQAQMEKAFNWAMKFHTKPTRYWEPATNHLIRVAIRIMRDYEVTDTNVITAALLYDIVDKHSKEITKNPEATADEALALLAEEFGPDVSGLVSTITNPEFDPDRDELRQYKQYVATILRDDDPRVRIIKVSVFTDNANGLIHMPSEGSINRAKVYAALVPVYEEAISEPDTPLTGGARAHIIKELDETGRHLELFTRYFN